MADSEIDRLYGLPLEDFVAERDALARRLRAAKDRAGAEAVKALTKPTRAAGVVNRLLREHPEEATALREAALALAAAQEELLAGGGADALRETADTARAAVEALVARVPDGESATTREAVRSTLTAATVDPEAREDVLAARLTRELVAAGFGGLAMVSAAPVRPAARAASSSPVQEAPVAAAARPRARKAADDDGARRAREAEERRAQEVADREEREARRRRGVLRRAKEAEAQAEHEVDAAQAAVAQVEATLVSRRADLRDAKARLTEARRRRVRAERAG